MVDNKDIARGARHNKHGLTGRSDQPGHTEDRSQALPFSLMLYDGEAGWEQYGVYETRADVDAQGERIAAKHSWTWGVCDTIWYLDCEDEIIRELPCLEQVPVNINTLELQLEIDKCERQTIHARINYNSAIRIQIQELSEELDLEKSRNLVLQTKNGELLKLMAAAEHCIGLKLKPDVVLSKLMEGLGRLNKISQSCGKCMDRGWVQRNGDDCSTETWCTCAFGRRKKELDT